MRATRLEKGKTLYLLISHTYRDGDRNFSQIHDTDAPGFLAQMTRGDGCLQKHFKVSEHDSRKGEIGESDVQH
eukprot:4947502-Heterocapsa_arctica.AAC.1